MPCKNSKQLIVWNYLYGLYFVGIEIKQGKCKIRVWDMLSGRDFMYCFFFCVLASILKSLKYNTAIEYVNGAKTYTVT